MNPIQRRRNARPQSALHPLGLAALLAVGGSAWALPQGATIVSGQIRIGTPTAGVQVITQGSQKGIIDWQNFSIASGEKVVFNQVSSSAVTLNRVVGYDPSRILGQMTANGHVFLINPQGVVFGSGARIDVGGMVASSLSLSNADFQAGNYALTSAPGAGLGAVRNQGVIHAADGGLVALVAPQVENTGEITGGRIGMAAVNAVSVDVEGDGMIFFRASATEAANRLDQLGRIRADGGTVELRAAARATMADTVLNMDGIVQARGLRGDGGTVVIDGGSRGITAVSGRVDASASAAGSEGGTVKVLGQNVGLFGQAAIDASGAAGGGTVLVGGNFQGKGEEHNAFRTFVGTGTTIRADALASGDGGRVIVWADDTTRFGGHISARGGLSGGDGGFAEVSGKSVLVFRGVADLGASHGKVGQLLLDPRDIIIAGGGDANDNPASFADETIGFAEPDTTSDVTLGVNTLNGSNADVTLQATRDIVLETNIAIGDAGIDLTMQAGNSIRSNSATARTITTNGGNLILLANDPASGAATGTGSISGIGAVTTTASAAGAASGAVEMRVLGGTGGITVANITTTGGSGGNGEAGSNGGNVTLSTVSGAITAGNINTNGGSAGSSNAAAPVAGNAGSITVDITAANGTGSTVTLGTLRALGGAGNQGGNGTDGSAGGTGGTVAINVAGSNSGVVTLGDIRTTGGVGGQANNDAGTNDESGGTGGTAGAITVATLNGITFSGASGTINARGGQGGSGNGADTRAGSGGASNTVTLVAATATSGGARTLTLPDDWLITTVGGAVGTGAGTGAPAGVAGTGGDVSLTGRGVDLGTGVDVGGGTLRVINAGTGSIAIDGNGGAIAIAGPIATTNATATAVTIRHASTVGLDDISAPSGTVTIGVGQDITGAVTQTGVITADTLTGSTAGAVTLGGNNLVATLGDFTTGGTFTLVDNGGGLAVSGTVTTGGTGLASIRTTGGALALTGSVAGAGVTLQTTSADDITLAGDVDGNAGTVTLDSGGAITQSAGAITAGGTLVLTAAGAIDLDQANALTTLGAVSRGGDFTLVDTGNANGLTVSGNIGTGGSVSITTSGGALALGSTTLNATNVGGTATLALDAVGVTQTSGTILVDTTSNINANAGSIQLASTTNNFGGGVTLASSVSGGDVAIRDTDALTLSAVTLGGTNTSFTAIAGGTLALPAQAISTGTANIDLRAGSGTLTTPGALTTTTGTIRLDGVGVTVSDVVTTGTGSVTVNAGTGTFENTQAIASKGVITISADAATIGADIGDATSAAVTIRPTTAGRAINVAFGADGAAALSLNATELDHLTDQGQNTGTLVIGAATSSGNLTIGDPLTATPLSVGGGGLSFLGTAARPVALNQGITLTSADPADLRIEGAVTLGQTLALNTAAGGGDIDLPGTVDGGGFGLSFDAGTTGVITVGGALSNADSLTVTNSGGASFDAVSVTNAITITDTSAGAAIAFLGDVSAGSFSLAAQAYDLTFAGSNTTLVGPGNTAFVFSNTGEVNLGNASTDVLTFSAGFDASAPSRVTIAGQVSTNNNNVQLGDVTTLTGALLNAGTGTIVIDGGGGALDLGTGTFRSAASGAGGPSIDIVDATTVALASLDATAADGAVRLGVLGNTLGTVTQNTGTTVSAATLSGRATGAATLDRANTIGTLGGFNAGAGLEVRDSGGGLTVTGTVAGGTGLTEIVTGGGALSLSGATVSGNGVRLETTTVHAITSTDATVNGGAGTVTLASDGAVSFTGTSQISTTGTLTGRAAGTVDITGPANTIGSLGAFNATDAFTLVDSAGGLTVTGAVTTNNGGLASITTTGDLTVGPGSVAGSGVTLTATGGNLQIQGNVNGTASGTVTLTAGAGGITKSGGVVTADALAVTSDGVIDVDGANVIGRLTAVGGTPTSIVVNDTAGGLLVQTAIDVSGNVRLSTNGGALALGANGVSGAAVQLDGASVSGTGVISATTLTVSADGVGGGVSLANTANTIGTLAAATVDGNFTLADTGTLTVSGNVSAGGALSITTTGALTLGSSNLAGDGLTLSAAGISGSGTVAGGTGTTLFDGGGGTIGLSGAISGANVTFRSASSVTIGAVNAAGGTVRLGDTGVGEAVGSVTGNGVITAGTLRGTTTGTADLDGVTNAIGTLGAFSGGSLLLADAGGLTVGGTVAVTGALTVTTTGGQLNLGASAVSAGGTMTLAGTGVAGTGVIDADTLVVTGGTAAVSLTNVNNTIGTLGASSGTGFTLVDTGGLTVAGNVSAGTGALALTTTGGALALGSSGLATDTTMTLTGAGVSGTGLVDAGTLVVNGGTGAVSLGNAGNTIGTLGNASGNGFLLADTGGLTVNGNVDAGSGALSITTTGGALALGNSNLDATGSGHLLRGVGVTQSAGGSIALAGATTVNAGNGAINLRADANDFGGSVTLISNAAVAVTDTNSLTIGSLTSGNNANVTLAAGAGGAGDLALTLPPTGLDIGTGVLSLTATGGSLEINGTVSAGQLVIAATDIRLGGSITTSAAGQSYTGGITLVDDLTLTTEVDDSNIVIAGGVAGGGNALSLVTNGDPTSTVQISGTVASVTTLAVAGAARINGTIDTSGNQSYADGITLLGNSVLDANGGTITVTGGIAGGGFDLDLASSALSASAINVGGAISGVDVLDALGNIRLGGNVTTTGAQTYGGSVTLAANATLRAPLLDFSNGLTAGANNLVLRTDTLNFAGALSGSGDLSFATDTAGRAIDVAQAGSGLVIPRAVFETDGFASITVGLANSGPVGFGAVTLFAPTVVNSGSDVGFAGAVNSAAGAPVALTVDAAGTTTFAGSVGTTTALASLTVTGDAVLGGGDIRATGAQDWGGDLALGGNSTLRGTSVSIGSGIGVDELSAGGNDLLIFANAISVDTVADSNSRVVLAPFGTGGSTGVAGGAGTLQLAQALLDKFQGSTTLQIGRGDGTGAINVGTLTLPTDTAFVSASGAVNFNGPVNGRTDGGQSLTVTTTGLTTFAADIGGTNRLSTVTTNGDNDVAPASGTIDTVIEADITTTGAQTFNDDVQLVGTRTLTGSAVVFNAGIGGDSIVLKPADAGDSIGIGVADGDPDAGDFDFRVSQEQLDKLLNFDEVVIGGTGAAGVDDVTGTVTIKSLTLQANLRVVSDIGEVGIVGALNAAAGGAATLTIETRGLTTVGANIGQTAALGGLTITGASQVNASAVTTSGGQVWGGDTTLGNSVTLTGATVDFGGDVQVDTNTLRVFSDAVAVGGAVTGIGGTVQLAPRLVGGSIGLAGAAGDLQISQDLLDSFAGLSQLTIGRTTGTGAIVADDLVLSTTTRLQSQSGGITFNGSIDAAVDTIGLTVATGGQTSVGGVVGGAGALGSLTIEGSTRLTGDTAVTAGSIAFGGTVDGARRLTLTAPEVSFGADVGGSTALTALTTTGAATLSGNVATTGAQRYGGNVVLSADATLSGASLRFDGAIDGNRALVLDGADGVRIDGSVGGSAALASLAVSGPTQLDADLVRTSGAQTWNGPVTLASGNATTLRAAAVTFAGTVDGAGDLTVRSTGLTRFGDAVGGTTELASLTLRDGGAAEIGGDIVRTSGAQSWSGAVGLAGPTTFRASALNFAGAVSGNGSLTLLTNTLTGAASLSGTGTLSIAARDATRTIELAPAAANGGRLQIAQSVVDGATGFDRHVIGTENGSGNIVANALDLTADTVLRTGSGDITLAGRVDGAFGLTLNAGGTTRIAGPVGVGTALTSLETDNAAGAADWNGTTGERTVFDTADGSGRARVVTTGAQTYRDPVVSSVPVQFNGGAITATQTANAFGAAVNADAGTLALASGQSITLGNVTLTNGGRVDTEGVLTLAGDVDLQGGTLVLVANATPTTLPALNDPEFVDANGNPIQKTFGQVLLSEASATINQTGGSVRTAGGTLLVLRTTNNGSIELQRAGNDMRGEISAVAGASGAASVEPDGSRPLSFVRIASTDILVAGSPTAGGTGDRLGIEGDVVKLTADRLSTGADGTIRARLPFRAFFGSSTQLPALTLVMSQEALALGNQFGSGNDPSGWIRVSIGDVQGAFLTVRPKEAGSDTAFILLSGDPAIQPFYDGAGKVTEVRVFYNGATTRTPEESGALAAVQALAEDARQTRFEEAVRTENVRSRLRSGVIAEVGAGRPATVGRESIKLPDNCEPKGKSLECQ